MPLPPLLPRACEPTTGCRALRTLRHHHTTLLWCLLGAAQFRGQLNETELRGVADSMVASGLD